MRKLVLAVAATLLALAFAPPGVASARNVNFSVTLRDTALIPVPDRGEEPPQRGDLLTGNARVFNAANRRQVGEAPIVCTWVAPPPRGAPRCLTQVFLARGSIVLAGPLENPVFRFQVIGGTGIYRRASGTALGRLLDESENPPIRLRFRLRGVR